MILNFLRLSFTLLITVVLFSGCAVQPTQFALIGDNPYDDDAFPKYARMVERINAHPGIDWVIHLGDMKSGGSGCSDEQIEALAVINGDFEMPFILTPGDNDWFDCIRESSGHWDRLGRLAKLREVMFAEAPDLPHVSQASTDNFSDYIENIYWERDGVLFATLHLVGLSGAEGGLDIHAEMQRAAINWLEVVFSLARDRNSKAVFLATQADIYPFTGERGWLKAECPDCPLVREHYEEFHSALLEQVKLFPRPVVLAVGDTHLFRVDKPLFDGEHLVENFTRVEGFGEDQVHWVRVVVRPESSSIFEFHQEIIPENIRKR